MSIPIIDEFIVDLNSEFADVKTAIEDSKIKESGSRYILVTAPVTHAGIITKNMTMYDPKSMIKDAESWLLPYPKPVLRHHAKKGAGLLGQGETRHEDLDPIGRVVDFKYVDMSNNMKDNITGLNPLGYIELTMAITAPDAVEKFLDGRYLTFSIGASADSAICSICGAEMAESPCSHKRGRKYKVKSDNDDNEKVERLCFWNVTGMEYKEVSIVNQPADELAATDKSKIKEIKNTQDGLSVFNAISILLADKSDNKIYQYESEEGLVDVTDSISEEIKDNLSKSSQEDSNTQDEDESLKDSNEKSVWPISVQETLKLEDAKIINYLTSKEAGHAHRAYIDPATGNGSTDYVDKHSHDIIDKKIKKFKRYKGDAEDEHSHTLGNEIEPIIYDSMEFINLEDDKPTENNTSQEDSDCVECDEKSNFEVQNSENYTEDELDNLYSLDELLEDEVEKVLKEAGKTKEEIKEAKLTTKKRKKLPESSFCGPNRSFPVNDCAHFTAAKRLIGRYKGEGSKTKILACIERKGKKLGCEGVKKNNDNTIMGLGIDIENAALLESVKEKQAEIKKIQEEKVMLENKLDEQERKIESLLTRINKVQEDDEKENLKIEKESLISQNKKLFSDNHILKSELIFEYQVKLGKVEVDMKDEDAIKKVIEDISKNKPEQLDELLISVRKEYNDNKKSADLGEVENNGYRTDDHLNSEGNNTSMTKTDSNRKLTEKLITQIIREASVKGFRKLNI